MKRSVLFCDGDAALVVDFDLFWGMTATSSLRRNITSRSVSLKALASEETNASMRAGIESDGDRVFPGSGDDLVGMVFMDEGDAPESSE